MSIRHWFVALAVGGAALSSVPASRAADPAPPLFAQYHQASADSAREQAWAWIKATGKVDEASCKAFEAAWQPGERLLLDRVADTLAIGDADAAKLLASLADESATLPEEPPALLRERTKPGFFRANLGLVYGRALVNRGLYDEGLDVLRLVRPEEVVDPAAYFFHRSVAEYSMLQKAEAEQSIARLGDVSDVPARYSVLALLMTEDMRHWKPGDLTWVAKRMKIIQERLAQAHGGQTTQKQQREVIAMLNKLIEEQEQPPQPPQPPGPPMPPEPPGPPGPRKPGPAVPGPGPGEPGYGPAPLNPMSPGGGTSPITKGEVDQRELEHRLKMWGKLPEKDRIAVMTELRRRLPPEQREMIESFQRRLGLWNPTDR